MNESKISIVIPTFNEEGNIEILYQKITEAFEGIAHANFEVIYVNDGSSDLSLEKIKSLSQTDSRVKFISFSRNFGHQNALKAGLDYAQGDAVISMDADLQHPPALIPEMIRLWQDGNQVVYSIRKDGKELSFLKKTTSKFFYKLINYLSDTKLEEGTADFRLLDKKVVKSFLILHPK